MTVTTIEQQEPDAVVILSDDDTNSRSVIEEEEKACHRLVDALSDSEKEAAARTSYTYFCESEAGTASAQRCNDYAQRMARRHYRASKGKEQVALESIKATIQWRQEMNMDDLRRIFDPEMKINPVDDDATQKKYQEMRVGLNNQMNNGKAYARGYDKKGRAIYVMNMHKCTKFDTHYYMAFHFYLMDRALAATERKTNGKEDQIVVVFDYSKYTLKNTVPLGLAKRSIYIYAHHYPEVLHTAFLLDTPLLFRAFRMVIRPFLDPDTKKKIRFVTGDADKRQVLGEVIAEDQATPFMYPEGQMTRPFDKDEFFYKTPYDQLFDER
jgi:hypothetical protein